MSKLWNLTGRVAFWMAWPALFVYLMHGERTRVVIRCGDRILAVRGWLGDGKWVLPGGGLHIGEPPLDGALREVREETGLTLDASQVHYLGDAKTTNGFRFRYHMFSVELTKQLITVPQKHEIIDIAWLPVHALQLKHFERSSAQALVVYLGRHA